MTENNKQLHVNQHKINYFRSKTFLHKHIIAIYLCAKFHILAQITTKINFVFNIF